MALSYQGRSIHLTAQAASIFLAGPTIADHQVPSNTTIFVFGKNEPSLFALNDNGQAVAEMRVVVTQPIEDLRLYSKLTTASRIVISADLGEMVSSERLKC
ncbi:hypothetical protein GPL17_26525 [Bradyrhizobium yuanmingense]|nr:pilus assembly protein N-terminal domain-containing protein [Bradyrhizobium yuanmingense]MVT54033.1 hypothetical protein [Bradyrhizobium yuanmingense]